MGTKFLYSFSMGTKNFAEKKTLKMLKKFPNHLPFEIMCPGSCDTLSDIKKDFKDTESACKVSIVNFKIINFN